MKNVLLVFGGRSYEHDISVVTAFQIYKKTRINDVKLIPLYISRDGKFYLYESKKFDIRDFACKNFTKKSKLFREIVFVGGEKGKLFVKSMFGLKEYLSAKLAIIACHGGSGENGKLVAFLEENGVFSTSGNFDALAVCMNKFIFKQVMRGIKVPVVSGFKLTKHDLKDENIKDKLDLRLRFMKFPVVLKPNNGGSSIGLFVVNNITEFYEKIEEVFEFDNEVIVEKFIASCREFNVAIVGDAESFEVSEIDEPMKTHEVLSFADKYMSGEKSLKGVKGENSMVGQLRKFPADVSIELSLKIKSLASKMFKMLNLSGVVRIDFLFDETKRKLYVCEVNSVPGSLSFYFFSGNKILVNSFIERLIDVAEKKMLNMAEPKIDFYTNILSD